MYMVAAGKGGVGKSTISMLIAMQLAAKSHKVGILDADIYGPSIPTIMRAEDEESSIENGKFQPLLMDGIKVMSIGFLVAKQNALAWRGPMLTKSLNQLLFMTNWGDLDYLIIDMPPGTGDVHLSISKLCEIDGVIIVTTPDEIAKRDVERAMNLYKKIGIKITGIVENMSYIKTENSTIFPFGTSSLDELADKYGTEKIATLPLIPCLGNNKNFSKMQDLQINFEF
ncbi:MAG: P-loop NTPase [Rickettsiaceae bacterium]|nr:P-loop NTPase [Rickettsiaceae bacterium]